MPRRTGNLFPRILDRENLRLAFYRALRGKRARFAARVFGDDLDNRLARMAAELGAESMQVGRYHQFVIHDPKERIITAPAFEERVLHHAIINVCEPVFESSLIHDTYACRRGRGRIAAMRRAMLFAGRHGAFLKLDVRKYFDSIGHNRLISRLGRLFKDAPLLRLFNRIIRAYRAEIGCGLPIGSLTSQHFANFFLGGFDRYVKEVLRVPAYVRYMDDMVIWGDTPAQLGAVAETAEQFLTAELGLELKGRPVINWTAHGMDFLGCRIRPTRIELNRRSRVRFRRTLIQLERQYLAGRISEEVLQIRATALVAFSTAGGTHSWRFRQRVLQQSQVDGL